MNSIHKSSHRHPPARRPVIAVAEARGLRTLHIGGEAIQSAMRVDAPSALALDYTRCMMAFLLFHPEPRQVLQIGLGGGSLAKFIHRHLPGTRQRIVENDPRVLGTARRHFALPADDRRLSVEIGDGGAEMSPHCCDVLIVDGFADEAAVPEFSSSAFYDAAWMALTARGVLVINFMSDDRRLDAAIRRLEASFDGAVVCLPALSDPNFIAFAIKGAPDALAWSDLERRARNLEAGLALPFRRYLGAIRRANPANREWLHIRPDPSAGYM